MKDKAKFGSKIGFILASVGSAVGMGNIWLFPYRLGQYGGAAFLLVYFGFVFLFGLVGLSGEFAFGRLTGTGPIGSYDYAMKTRGKKGGAVLGAIPLIGSLGIAIGYAIIVGWILRYLIGSLTGTMMQVDTTKYFSQVTGKFGSVPWHILVVFLTMAVLARGVSKGIEKINRIIMPAFFVLFFIVAVRVFFLRGAFAGYEYLLVPRWELLRKPETWVMAMGQAFFSLSITGSGMVIYGSYLDKKENIVNVALTTALLDTIAAILAGFAIIPAVFAFRMDPSSGPPLMFLTLPKVFAQIPAGRWLSVIFFLSVLFAGVTSLVNMFEVCSEALQTHIHMSRKKSILLVGAVVFFVGLFIEYEPYMGAWMDIITVYVVPFGAVLCAIIVYWVLKNRSILKELNLSREKPLGSMYFYTGKYIYVLLTVLVFILSIVYKGIG